MDYKVKLTYDAENDLDRHVRYVLFEKKNPQAAKSIIDDFEETKKRLSKIASSIRPCENPRLKDQGYYRINFIAHRYFMLYRIENDEAIVDNIFHMLEDYENKMN